MIPSWSVFNETDKVCYIMSLFKYQILLFVNISEKAGFMIFGNVLYVHKSISITFTAPMQLMGM
jgi:hypothetical protein